MSRRAGSDGGTWYDVLSVAPDAPHQVVRAAYMQLAKLYHPDGESPDEGRMKQLNAAWEVLGSANRRAVYDAELKLSELARQRHEREARRSTEQPEPPGPPEPQGPPAGTSGEAPGEQGWGEPDDPAPPGQPAAVPVYLLRPLELPAVVVSIVLAILGAGSVNAAAALWGQSQVLGRLGDDLGAGTVTPEAAITELDRVSSEVSIAVDLAVLAAAVALLGFVNWQHRHAVNSERLAGPYPLGPRWVLRGWGMLLLCCFAPAVGIGLAGMQLFQASRATTGSGTSNTTGRSLVVICGLMLAWAVQLLLLGFGDPASSGGLVGDLTGGGPDDLDAANLSTWSSVSRTAAGLWAVLALAAFLSIAMVRHLTRSQMSAPLRPVQGFGPSHGQSGPGGRR